MIQVPLRPAGQYIGLCGRVDWCRSGFFAQFQESSWMNGKQNYRERVEQELIALHDRLQLKKLFKRIIFLYIFLMLCIIVDCGLFALSTSNAKLVLVANIIFLVLVVAVLVIQIVTVVQIKSRIKKGADEVSSRLQSEGMNIYIQLRSDSCWVKMYGRLQYRFNFYEVYEFQNY